MTNYYIEAVRIWQQANHDLRRFAECCAQVDGRKTQALAQDCKVSVDTIENYRNAFILFRKIEILEETSEPARIWSETNIAVWVKAAQLKTRLKLSFETVYEYLKTANEYDMTRESLAAHVDEKENQIPKWIRRLRQAIRFLRPSRDDFKSEMPPILQERYNRAVAAFVKELEAIATESETE